MIIAEQKKRTNIAEYILYMWQIEDIIRVYKLDIELINKNIIEKFDQPESVKREIKLWYSELIDLMKLENISEHGHLKFIIRIIGKLNDLHIYLLKTKIEIKYHEYFTKAYPNIEEFRLKLNNPDGNDIEICFNALYALLLLRLKKTEISAETNNAMTTFSNLLAYLSVKYKQNQN